ncbi:MAG: DivIVA domain-containing protein [Mycobacteriaceae bacterium]
MSRPGSTPDEVHDVRFSTPPLGSRGHNEDEVDAFLDEGEQTLRAGEPVHLDGARLRPPVIGRRGYDEAQVDAFLARLVGVDDLSARAAAAPGQLSGGGDQPFVTSPGWRSRLRHRG